MHLLNPDFESVSYIHFIFYDYLMKYHLSSTLSFRRAKQSAELESAEYSVFCGINVSQLLRVPISKHCYRFTLAYCFFDDVQITQSAHKHLMAETLARKGK
jgi:hypothetical protein